MRYDQVLLETGDGLFSVSVAGVVMLDNRLRIVSPQEVFEEGSTIVAVEQGVLRAGEYREAPNPQEAADSKAKAGGNGGMRNPGVIQSPGPRTGTFIVKHNQAGGVDLQRLPVVLGQLS